MNSSQSVALPQGHSVVQQHKNCLVKVIHPSRKKIILKKCWKHHLSPPFTRLWPPSPPTLDPLNIRAHLFSARACCSCNLDIDCFVRCSKFSSPSFQSSQKFPPLRFIGGTNIILQAIKTLFLGEAWDFFYMLDWVWMMDDFDPQKSPKVSVYGYKTPATKESSVDMLRRRDIPPTQPKWRRVVTVICVGTSQTIQKWMVPTIEESVKILRQTTIIFMEISSPGLSLFRKIRSLLAPAT